MVAAGVLTAMMRGRHAPVPSLTAGALTPVPLVAVVGLVVPFALLRAFEGLPAASATTAARTLAMSRIGLATVVIVGGASIAGLLAGTGAALECGRDAATLTGVALLGARARSHSGALCASLGYLCVTFFLGRGSGASTPAWWAWLLSDPGDAASMCCAAAVLLSGFAVVPALPRIAMLHGEASA